MIRDIKKSVKSIFKEFITQMNQDKSRIPANILYSTNKALENAVGLKHSLLIYKKQDKNGIHLRLYTYASFQNLFTKNFQIVFCIH